MYLSFFNLRESPFNLTPDPRFLFLSPQHEEALSHLFYGIYERKGFIEITGEVGMGKTVLCRALLERLDEKVSTALIFNSYLTRMELLQAITHDFGLTPEETTCKGYIDVLNTYLLQEFSAGHNAVVIIDEAQNLEPIVLEQLRMLSNLETEQGKLLQVVLVGQPELQDKLAARNMRQLEQRIAVRFHLHEFTRHETAQYITHRMSVAGAANKVRIRRRALNLIHHYSEGLPRRINLLCDRVLMTAFVRETSRITPTIVRRSIQELEGSSQTPRPRSLPLFSGVLRGLLGGVGVLGLFGGVLLLPGVHNRLAPQFLEPLVAFRQLPVAPPVPAPMVLPSLPSPVVSVPVEPPAPISAEISNEFVQTLWQVKLQAEALALARVATSWERSLTDAASAVGLDVLPFRAAIWQLPDISRPCFIELLPESNATHAELGILVKGQAREVVMYQEGQGFSSLPLRQLRHRWSGTLYLTAEVDIYREAPLRQGMNGERVRALQHALQVRGYLREPPSGQFDGPTQEAVKRFQRDYQLVIDGYVGRQTLMMLLHFSGDAMEHTT